MTEQVWHSPHILHRKSVELGLVCWFAKLGLEAFKVIRDVDERRDLPQIGWSAVNVSREDLI